MNLTIRKAGKRKGKTEISYADENWYTKLKSKYRKKKPNRFDHQKRFLSVFDISEMKKMESITNSQIKRGEKERGNSAAHYVCGCGVEACVGHNEWKQEPLNK